MHHAVDTIKNYIVSNLYNSRISHPTPKVSLKILTKNKQRKKNHLCALITLFKNGSDTHQTAKILLNVYRISIQ